MLHVITMAAPTPVEVVAGDVVRIDTSFDYKGEEQTVPVYAGIGNSGLFGFNPVEPNEGTVAVDVNSPSDFTTYEASVLIQITDNLSPGTYDVMACVSGHSETEVIAQDVVIIPGASDWTSMLGAMMMVLMLGMVAPMITEGMAGEENGAVMAG